MIYCLFSHTVKRDEESFIYEDRLASNHRPLNSFQNNLSIIKKHCLIDKTFIIKTKKSPLLPP